MVIQSTTPVRESVGYVESAQANTDAKSCRFRLPNVPRRYYSALAFDMNVMRGPPGLVAENGALLVPTHHHHARAPEFVQGPGYLRAYASISFLGG